MPVVNISVGKERLPPPPPPKETQLQISFQISKSHKMGIQIDMIPSQQDKKTGLR